MSRTPKYNIRALPKWVQTLIDEQTAIIGALQLDLETAYGWVNNLEDTLEEISKNDKCEGDCRQPKSNGFTPDDH